MMRQHQFIHKTNRARVKGENLLFLLLLFVDILLAVIFFAMRKEIYFSCGKLYFDCVEDILLAVIIPMNSKLAKRI